MPANFSPAEVGRLVRAFALLGQWKVRLTGGEPSLQPEQLEIAQIVADTPWILRLAMTANGYRLAHCARDYAAAGRSPRRSRDRTTAQSAWLDPPAARAGCRSDCGIRQHGATPGRLRDVRILRMRT